MTRRLPTGTVTFLFTDIEGSTRLMEELGEHSYVEALRWHRTALRTVFTAHGGAEVDTQGDAFLYAFTDPREAVAAAAEGQQVLASGQVQVRMGVHTGKTLLTGEGYAGRELHRAARIAASGHGGQVLVSAATAALLDGELTALGEHRLKDFEQPVEIFQLGSEHFPPLKTISNTNLPRPASSFVGRERETKEIRELLEDGTRLVTLSGPGGSGKTRLALEAASELVGEFGAGVFWVGLASIRDPALVTEAIAHTLGAKEDLAEHIGEREMLLLLDNVEHVIEAAPELGSLLRACPRLKLLVTSRELLRISGEVDYAVPSLRDEEAIELFCARGRLDPEEPIAELCRRLDNLPLAIELAAARTSVLTPAQILERLSTRLDLFKGGRDAEARQQTLRATIEWSYELLTEREKRLFARLAVFQGGCTLQAAVEVTEADLDTQQSLVDKSLLRHSGGRFWMLETIRDFAFERLQEYADEEVMLRRHASFFADLAEQAAARQEDPQAGALRRLETEYANVRGALDWARGHDRLLFVQLTGALGWFWLRTARLREGREHLDAALNFECVPARMRARAEAFAGSLRLPSGELEDGERLLTSALARWRELGDDGGVASTLMALGWVHLAYHARGEEGHTQRARESFEEALRLWRVDRPHEHFGALNALCMVDIEQGRIAEAQARAEAALEQARVAGNSFVEQMASHYLGDCALLRSDYREAALRYGRCLELTWEAGEPRQSAAELLGYAMAIAGEGRSIEALRLAGAWRGFRRERGIRGGPRFWRELQERELGRARQGLPRETAEEAWQEGLALPLEEAVASALSERPAGADPLLDTA